MGEAERVDVGRGDLLRDVRDSPLVLSHPQYQFCCGHGQDSAVNPLAAPKGGVDFVGSGEEVPEFDQSVGWQGGGRCRGGCDRQREDGEAPEDLHDRG